MGLFDRIFGKYRKTNRNASGEYKMLTPYSPVFYSYNGEIYENLLCRTAINCNAKHISKLKIEFTGHGTRFLKERLQRPNALQTWSQFMERLATVFYTDNTAFIVPVLDSMNRVREIYAVLPQRCKMIQVNDEPWLAFEFRDGKYAQVPVWRVGIMRRFQYKNDIFGESNRALDTTLNLIAIQDQGIQEATRSSATYRFMAQMGNLANDEDIDEDRRKFNEKNFSNNKSSGLILFPYNWNNIQQISSKPFIVDAEERKLIKENVCEYYGVNDEVLQNKSYGDGWTAYYEGEIETFAIQFSEVITQMMYLNGEFSRDAKIMATANRLQCMSNKEKLEMSTQLPDRGILNRDEVREIWNLPPLPDGQGKEYIIRGEYKNAAEQLESEE